MKNTTGGTGRMVADCPNCKDFIEERTEAHRIGLFRDSSGSVHAAPDMWLAGRCQWIERQAPKAKATEVYLAAWRDWTLGCEMARRVAAQREAA